MDRNEQNRAKAIQREKALAKRRRIAKFNKFFKNGLGGLAPLMIFTAVVINIGMLIASLNAAGLGFGGMIKISNFGLTMLMWDFNPIMVVLSIVLFFGGFFTLIFRSRFT